MTAFDYAFIALLAAFAIGGLMRGLVREVFGLLAWVASVPGHPSGSPGGSSPS